MTPTAFNTPGHPLFGARKPRAWQVMAGPAGVPAWAADDAPMTPWKQAYQQSGGKMTAQQGLKLTSKIGSAPQDWQLDRMRSKPLDYLNMQNYNAARSNANDPQNLFGGDALPTQTAPQNPLLANLQRKLTRPLTI